MAHPGTTRPARTVGLGARIAWLLTAAAMAFLGHGLFDDSHVLDAIRLRLVGRSFEGELLAVDSERDVVGAGTRHNLWGLLQKRELSVRFGYRAEDGVWRVVRHRVSDAETWQRYAALGEGRIRVIALRSRPALAMPADDVHFAELELAFALGFFALAALSLAFALGFRAWERFHPAET